MWDEEGVGLRGMEKDEGEVKGGSSWVGKITEITNLIGKVAKRLGYDVVFVNTALVIGGIDITEEVLKEMK